MAVVILLFAVVVIVLEIINLLMDMRDTLLREEGGFIFSYLILLGATLLASVLHSLYLAISNLLITDDRVNEKIEKIYQNVIDGMCEAVERKVNRLRAGYRREGKMTFFIRSTAELRESEGDKSEQSAKNAADIENALCPRERAARSYCSLQSFVWRSRRFHNCAGHEELYLP